MKKGIRQQQIRAYYQHNKHPCVSQYVRCAEYHARWVHDVHAVISQNAFEFGTMSQCGLETMRTKGDGEEHIDMYT